MFRNYFKIALRNLWRQRGFSFINIGGLAIGLTAFCLILIYVSFELSYDNFHSKSAHIYRVVSDLKTPTDVAKFDNPPIAVPPHLEEEFEEIISSVRVMPIAIDVRNQDIKFKEKNAIAADSSFFNMFDFKLLQGDKSQVLKEPFSIVLSENISKKYFGNSSPIGKTLVLKDEDIDSRSFTVTGLMEKFPENSHIQADMVISMTTYSQGIMTEFDNFWGLYDPSAYVLLNAKSNPKILESKFPDFIERHIGKELKADKMELKLFLEPLSSIYLQSDRGADISGDMNLIYVFSIVALFILLIACINFINLTTARSIERAKEVGVRKVIGAEKRQLAFQFIGESVIICCIAYLVTIVLTMLLLPTFTMVTGKTMALTFFDLSGLFLVLCFIALSIGILAGTYPAFVLSSFRPVNVLKGNFATGKSGIALRKGLVITQFTISIALIVGTVIIYNQMSFMQNQELGFTKDQILVLETTVSTQQQALKEKLKSIPGVISTGLSSSVPGVVNHVASSIVQNNLGEDQIANLDAYFVDYDFVSQFDLKLVAGRDFSRDFVTDSTEAMIVNEQTVKMFGYSNPEQAIGAKFSQWGKMGKIIGVVKDFHFKTLQENIKPITLAFGKSKADLLVVKIKPLETEKTVASIKEEWETFLPNATFSYYFLDEAFDRQYRAQKQFGTLFLSFATLAILISCMGLLGLAAYSTMQRKREIGVRKVLGASVFNVVGLLSQEFLILVGIAFIMAVPIAWYLMGLWLKDFAYHIDMQWWMFAVAGISALVIALLTVSFHAVKAAIVNPVKSLRTE